MLVSYHLLPLCARGGGVHCHPLSGSNHSKSRNTLASDPKAHTFSITITYFMVFSVLTR